MNRLKELIEERGITLRTLSKLSGIPAATISELVNDKRRARRSTLERLAAALRVDMSELWSLLDNTSYSRGVKGSDKRWEGKRVNKFLTSLAEESISEHSPDSIEEESISNLPLAIANTPKRIAVSSAELLPEAEDPKRDTVVIAMPSIKINKKNQSRGLNKEGLRQDADRVQQAREEARQARKDKPKTPPLHLWLGFEDGSVKHFSSGDKKYQQARECAREQNQKFRVYQGTSKANKKVMYAHSEFIVTHRRNGHTDWPRRPFDEVIEIG